MLLVIRSYIVIHYKGARSRHFDEEFLLRDDLADWVEVCSSGLGIRYPFPALSTRAFSHCFCPPVLIQISSSSETLSCNSHPYLAHQVFWQPEVCDTASMKS